MCLRADRAVCPDDGAACRRGVANWFSDRRPNAGCWFGNPAHRRQPARAADARMGRFDAGGAASSAAGSRRLQCSQAQHGIGRNAGRSWALSTVRRKADGVVELAAMAPCRIGTQPLTVRLQNTQTARSAPWRHGVERWADDVSPVGRLPAVLQRRPAARRQSPRSCGTSAGAAPGRTRRRRS